jgi:ATP-binding cassette subfamily B multidrug efflux pump
LSDHDDQTPARLVPPTSAIRRLLPLAGRTRLFLPLAFFLLLLLAGVEVTLPQLVKLAIDGPLSNLGARDRGYASEQLEDLGLLFAGLLVVAFVANYLSTLLLHQFGQTLVLNLRHQLFAKLHRLPIAYFDKHAVGRTVSRVVNDSNAISELFTNVLAAGLGDALLILGILGVLLWTNPLLAFILFAFFPIMVAVVLWFRSRSAPLYETQRKLLAIINGFLAEVLEGLPTVKSFGGEGFLRDRFAVLNARCLDNEVDLVGKVAMFRPAFSVSQIAATGLLIGLGGAAVVQDSISLGTLVSSLLYVRLLFSPLEELADRYNILIRATVASGRVLAILDLEEEPTGQALPAHRAEICFDRVSYFYSPDKPVLREVSFRVGPGETVALVGPTGSGKSTIISLLLGFYRLNPTAGHGGTVTYGGTPLHELDLASWRRRLAFVSQDLFLFKAPVRDNIRLFAEVSDATTNQAITDAGADFVRRLPDGLDTMVGEKGHALSTGQRQLLSFARALAFDPELLILDEATANIDSETEAALELVLDRLLQGRQAIIVAHRLATVRRADTILVLRDGHIVERGSHARLMQSGGLYADMVRRAERAGRTEITADPPED